MMAEPLDRVFVLHVANVLGAVPLSIAGAPAGGVAVMVLAKTYFDHRAHRRTHERARDRSAAETGLPG